MYLYWVYGVSIGSEFELPELHPCNGGAAEVTVRLGPVPDELGNASTFGVLYQAAPNLFRMTVDGVGKFSVRDGIEIVVDRDERASWEEIRVFLLGSAFGALLHQRGVLPLHAGAIEVDGGCVAFAGRSGIGKSTLTAAFILAGYSLVADDVLVLTPSSSPGRAGNILAWPAYPQLKVWADSAHRLGLSTRMLRPLPAQEEKYALPVQKSHMNKPLPLRRLYVLELSDNDRLSLEPLGGSEKLEALMNHTYRIQYLAGLECKPHHFRLCNELGQSIPVLRVFRPRRGFELTRLLEMLERDWSG